MDFIKSKLQRFLGKGVRKSSLFKSFSANINAQISNAVIQFLGVPILLKAFGVDVFGEYLVISAIPSFFFFIDLGLGVSLSNQMTAAYSAKNYKRCRLFSDTYLCFNLIFLTTLTLLAGLSFFVNFRDTLTLRLNTNLFYWQCFFGLFLLAIGNNIVGMIAFFLRALNLNGLGINLATIQRSLTMMTLWITAIISHNMLTAIYCSVLVEVVFVIASFIWYNKKFGNMLPIRTKYFSRRVLGTSLKPGISYLLLTIGNTILLQGTTLIVNKFLGPSSVVLYTTTRTLANLLRQFTNMITNSMWPELTVAIGQGKWQKTKTLFGKALKASVLSMCLLVVIFIVTGRIIFNLWLGDTVSFDFSFYALMLVSNIFYSVWFTASMLPFSMNKFGFIGPLFMTFSVINVVVIYFSGVLGFDLLYTVPLTIIITEAAMVSLILPYCRKQLANSIIE